MEEEYLQQLFNYIGSVDPSFKDSYSLEGFTNDMQDKKYAAEMYNYIGGIDETFKANYTIEGFLNDVTVKKKDSQPDGEPMEDTVSPIQQPQEQDTSSDLSLAETYQQFQEPETQIPFRPEEQPTEEEGVIEYDISKFTSEELERQDKINAAKKEFKDLQNLNFELTKNDASVQRGHTRLMLYTIDQLIAYVSEFFTLKIGDILFTGTPAGVGAVQENDRLEGFLEGQKLLDLKIK